MEKRKQVLYSFLVGMSVGISGLAVMFLIMFFSGNLPWLKAAGVGTGAPDVNARYLDGYGTSLTAGANKIYISDGSNYLPDSTVDSGAIVDGTIGSADIADDSVSITADLDLSTDGAGSGLDADKIDGHDYSSGWDADTSSTNELQHTSAGCVTEPSPDSSYTGTTLCQHYGYTTCLGCYHDAGYCSNAGFFSACDDSSIGGTDETGSCACIKLSQ